VETDFEYERISPEAFEQLAVALAEMAIGHGIEVYGPGRDGGREATYTGPIDWSATGDGDKWNGYTVVQAKQCQTPSDPAGNLQWLNSTLREEFKRWMDPDSRRTQFPQYLLVITNVRLSAADPAGGIDEIRSLIDHWLKYEFEFDGHEPSTLRRRGLRDVKVWHRDKLNVLVSINRDVRQRFAPLLTMGDILARLERLDQLLPGLIPPDDIAGVLVDHAQTTIQGERWVRFDEAGDDFNRQSVERVIVDLPVLDQKGNRGLALQVVLERGSRVLSQSLWKATEADEPQPPRHLVITGAPGNGKSTIAKYLTQVFRASFARADANEPAVQAIIDDTDKSLDRLKLTAPQSPRWPIRIDLAPMAERMGPDSGGPNIRTYLCQQITLDSSVPVHLGTLDQWLKLWPSIILLDGLDEVTHPAVRQRVLGEITALVDKANALDCDLLVVVTTRPTGYTSLLPDHFEQIDLTEFTRQEAQRYGRHVTAQRLAGDPVFRRTALKRFEDAAKSPAVERLLTTPLQVLILTVIVARSGPLPANRYELFWTYYDTVFKREAAKPTTYRNFINDHRAEITDLHQRVGVVLHRYCEATRELRGRLPMVELKEIARDRMIKLGYGIPEANDLANTMVTVATHRLVLLVADEDETVSFDIRSLQELMAGCALVDMPEADQRENLVTAACSPHWRNAWLFGAGRLFTGNDHQRNLVLKVVEQCDEVGHWHGWLYPAAPELAADLLDDGLAANRPNDRRRLIEVVLRVLSGPLPTDPKSLAMKLAAATNETGHTGPDVAGIRSDRLFVRDRLRDAFARNTPDEVGYAVGAILLRFGAFGAHIPGQPADLSQFVDLWNERGPGGQMVEIGQFLLDTLQSYAPESYPPTTLVLRALDECNQLRMRRGKQGNLLPVINFRKAFGAHDLYAALEDSEAEQDLQIIIAAVPPEGWPVITFLAQRYWPTASRWPISERLRVAGDDPPGQEPQS
ncbi:hypothetical protein AU072_18345, partial [Mycobacterium rhizamassiliense]